MTNDEKSEAIADKIEREISALSWPPHRRPLARAMTRVAQFAAGVATGTLPPDAQPVTLADVAESKDKLAALLKTQEQLTGRPNLSESGK